MTRRNRTAVRNRTRYQSVLDATMKANDGESTETDLRKTMKKLEAKEKNRNTQQRRRASKLRGQSPEKGAEKDGLEPTTTETAIMTKIAKMKARTTQEARVGSNQGFDVPTGTERLRRGVYRRENAPWR